MSQRLRVVVAVAAVALNLVVLYAPRAPSVSAGGLPLDKLVHVLVFALPTLALVRAGLPRFWVVVAMSMHAALSELVQHLWLGHRSGDAGDVVADLVGVALGAAVVRMWRPGAGETPTRTGAVRLTGDPPARP